MIGNVELTHQALENYHRAIDEAANAEDSDARKLRPWVPEERHALRAALKKCLGIRDGWIPEIAIERSRTMEFEGLQIELIEGRSWPDTVVPATCTRRPNLETPAPAVLLCCGHGDRCKFNTGYQQMAMYLARAGAVVLTADNIGQGEREPMGHKHELGPLACGIALQGLITMESMAWIDWLRRRSWVDSARIAAIGNSGGGKTTQTLACLREDLAAVASSGYGENMANKAHKERALCACTIFPGVLGKYDDWQLYGCRAPRPLFLFQGNLDSMFPQDVFRRTARQVRRCYEALDAAAGFAARLVPGEHSWDEERMILVRSYLAERLGLDPPAEEDHPGSAPVVAAEIRVCDPWPEQAHGTAELAQYLTGKRIRGKPELWDLFPPVLPVDDIAQVLAPVENRPKATGRPDARWVLAQMEALLRGFPDLVDTPMIDNQAQEDSINP
jgi:dienelactone hydrolase